MFAEWNIEIERVYNMYFCGIFIAFAYTLPKISTGNSRIGTKHH